MKLSRRMGESSGIARNARPQLKMTPEGGSFTTDPYAALRRARVPSNPFFAYRSFLRRLRHAA